MVTPSLLMQAVNAGLLNIPPPRPPAGLPLTDGFGVEVPDGFDPLEDLEPPEDCEELEELELLDAPGSAPGAAPGPPAPPTPAGRTRTVTVSPALSDDGSVTVMVTVLPEILEIFPAADVPKPPAPPAKPLAPLAPPLKPAAPPKPPAAPARAPNALRSAEILGVAEEAAE